MTNALCVAIHKVQFGDWRRPQEHRCHLGEASPVSRNLVNFNLLSAACFENVCLWVALAGIARRKAVSNPFLDASIPRRAAPAQGERHRVHGSESTVQEKDPVRTTIRTPRPATGRRASLFFPPCVLGHFPLPARGNTGLIVTSVLQRINLTLIKDANTREGLGKGSSVESGPGSFYAQVLPTCELWPQPWKALGSTPLCDQHNAGRERSRA